MADVRHFLSLLDFSPEELEALIARGTEMRRMHENGTVHQPLRGATLGMIFEMSSTRTRVGFEAGMAQLGGHAIYLSPSGSQLGRGEPVEDTARVLGEMLDLVMIRTQRHTTVERYAAESPIPVINAMTERLHPCQLLADVQTMVELRGSIQGAKVAFVGDGYNMCHSYILAARQFGFHLTAACPAGFEPDADIVEAGGNAVRVVHDPVEAVRDADLVVTDVWSSMGHESDKDRRKRAFRGFQINAGMLDHADSDVVFLHCLPAHRGEEVDEHVLDDPRSAVFHAAGNRMHSQKALMERLYVPRPR